MSLGKLRRGAPSLMTLAGVALTVVLTAMIPLSLGRYTSTGFDLEYLRQHKVIEEFYRIRWPGDGSFRIGCGAIHYSLDEEDVDTIDLGLRVLDEPQYPVHPKWWKRFLFATHVPEGNKGDLRSSTWLIVPSWFPASIALVLLVIGHRLRRRRTPPAAE